jgi:hypothetical protein
MVEKAKRLYLFESTKVYGRQYEITYFACSFEMVDEFGVTFCKDIFVFICCQSVFLIVLLFFSDTLLIKPVGSMLLIPKPTTGHNPVPAVSTYSSHSFLTSHSLGVIRCCFPGCMEILCAFLVCPILAKSSYTHKLSFSFCTLPL